MSNRRQFVVGMAAGVVGGARFAWGQQSAKQDPPLKLDAALVGRFVGKSHGDLETVKQLLKEEPALVHASWDWGDGDYETGLNAASHVGRRDIAEYLLEQGARPDAPAFVMLGMKSIVKEMLRELPKLHAVPGAHRIPLLSHAIFGRERADGVFDLLLESGADVNAQSNMKMTPLMAAASIGRISQVQRLLELGADRNIVNTKGETALDIATRKEKHKCIKALQAAS